jgi:alpha-glucuronidase
VQKIYESLQSTPDELVLFFHHVPYTYKLHSGKTVIQTIYDSHYDGALRTEEFVSLWKLLKGKVDHERYCAVLDQLKYQAGHAIVWRDAINNWFHKISGVADVKNRVGNHPHRWETEAMRLRGYDPVDAKRWEGASGKAVVCASGHQQCSAELVFTGRAGWYQLDIQYFDQNNGRARFQVFIGKQLIDEWVADLLLPSTEPNADSSTHRRIKRLALRPGDLLRIEGLPDSNELAPLDYIEIIPIPH